jgi:hypothetical protein
MKSAEAEVHHKHHKVTITAILLGIVLLAAGLANQFYLAEPLFHPLAGYILVVPGVVLILRALRPPIGFLRVSFSLVGGACLGASLVFYESNSPSPPWISIGLVLIGAAILGGCFTPRVKVHHTHWA